MGDSKHPLENTWVLWYDSKKTQKTDNWEDSLLQVQEMSTVEEFWAAYNHIKRPAALELGANYHFFKKGIKPMWEDEHNKKGGKWIVAVMQKEELSRLDEFWQHLLLSLIGETLDEDIEGDQVCGCVLGKRRNMAKIAVWIRDKAHEDQILRLGKKLKDVLQLDTTSTLEFTPHDARDAQFKL
jgi:translation initiation factor 4E